MINSLNEKDILDYLMTSDFTEGLTQEESKFLLLKYRYHYRIIHSKNQSLNYTIEEMEEKIKNLENNNNQLLKELSDVKNEFETEKTRKLSWKERFFGKKNKLKNGYK